MNRSHISAAVVRELLFRVVPVLLQEIDDLTQRDAIL
jgi:hypothetical protein